VWDLVFTKRYRRWRAMAALPLEHIVRHRLAAPQATFVAFVQIREVDALIAAGRRAGSLDRFPGFLLADKKVINAALISSICTALAVVLAGWVL
jgi:hypothetical protein